MVVDFADVLSTNWNDEVTRMALAKKRSNTTRLAVIVVVVLVVAGVGYVLFREFFLKGSDSGEAANAANRSKAVITDFSESILHDQRYTNLQTYDISISADANTDGGQVNPFH